MIIYNDKYEELIYCGRSRVYSKNRGFEDADRCSIYYKPSTKVSLEVIESTLSKRLFKDLHNLYTKGDNIHTLVEKFEKPKDPRVFFVRYDIDPFNAVIFCKEKSYYETGREFQAPGSLNQLVNPIIESVAYDVIMFETNENN